VTVIKVCDDLFLELVTAPPS